MRTEDEIREARGQLQQAREHMLAGLDSVVDMKPDELAVRSVRVAAVNAAIEMLGWVLGEAEIQQTRH